MKVFVSTLSSHLRDVIENLEIKCQVQRVTRVHGNSQSIICFVSTNDKKDMGKILELLDDLGHKYSKAEFGAEYDNLFQWKLCASVEKVAEACEKFDNKLISRYYLHSSGDNETCLEVILNEQLHEDWRTGFNMLFKCLGAMGIK